MWILAAVFSAFFAGVTAILSKCGIKNTSTNVATAIRTSVVLVFSWAMVFISGAYVGIDKIDLKSWIFLIASGAATGISWICYFKALALGEVSKVAAVDKSSVVLSVAFALILFPEERNSLPIKLVCLILIATGTFLMTDIKIGKKAGECEKTRGETREKTYDKAFEKTQSLSWLFFAILSAIFAAATSLLAKAGIKNVDSNLATAIRTSVVFVCAWAIVAGKGELGLVKSVTKTDAVFLTLSGFATGASWLCYYYAIAKGQVSVVVPIDKTSVLITVLFSLFVFKEKLSKKAWLGLGLLTAGAVLMAVLA